MKPSILIVDDQPDNIRTLSVMLKSEGYKVRQALSGVAALGSIQVSPPDLILLDIMMPHMNGYEVCSTLKNLNEFSEIPVIFLSALDDIADKTKAFTLGGMDYITKPFQAEEVLLRVRHQLTIRRQQQELIEKNRRLQEEIRERQRAEEMIQQQFQREKLLAQITQYIHQSLQLDEILQIAIKEVRQSLACDRVLVCRLFPDWSGEIIAESVQLSQFSLLGHTLHDPRFQTYWQQHAQSTPTYAINDIYTATLPADYFEFLVSLQIRSSLCVPIPQADSHSWGLLIAHHCLNAYRWEEWEIDFLQHIATQMAIAINQSQLYQNLEEQVKERTSELQQALEFETLLKDITDKVRDRLDEHQILQAAVEELAEVLDAQCCNSSLYDLDSKQATIAYENQSCQLSAVGRTIPIQADPIYLQLLQKQTFQFCWLQPNQDQPNLEKYAILACPVFDDQRVLGDLWLFKPKVLLFDELEVRLAKQVANQCAIALRQARLYQAAQTQVLELQRLNQLKDDFLSTISHELRTPIANIKLVTRLLMIATNKKPFSALKGTDNGVTPEKVEEYLQILQYECERELNLIQDLLNLQHLEAGTLPLDPVPIPLDSWLSHLLKPFEIRAANQQQILETQLKPDLPLLITDSFCLSRIVTELVNNACKYTPPGEIISISADFKDNLLSLSVANSGVEIAPEESLRIFDKFYRIPNNDPWKHGGTGLGLALVHKLVNYICGTIAVTSENNQTIFIVKLPLSLPPHNSQTKFPAI